MNISLTPSAIEQLFVVCIGLDSESHSHLESHLSTWGVPLESLDDLNELHSFHMPPSYRGALLCCDPKTLGELASCLESLGDFQPFNTPCPIILLGDEQMLDNLPAESTAMICCVLPVPLDKVRTYLCLNHSLSKFLPSPVHTRPRLNILVMGEDLIHKRYISKMLFMAGHEVVTPSDFSSALVLLSTGEIHTLIIDLDTDLLMGVELAALCRSTYENMCEVISTHKRPPFVVFTATASFDLVSDEHLVSADTFITKPINIGTLFDALESYYF